MSFFLALKQNSKTLLELDIHERLKISSMNFETLDGRLPSRASA